MKTIIAGSRSIKDINHVFQALKDATFVVTEVVSGAARGVDQLGEETAGRLAIPVKRFPADWERYGRGAGIRRNYEMADYADALIAIWDGRSTGTEHMIVTAREKGLKVYVRDLSPPRTGGFFPKE